MRFSIPCLATEIRALSPDREQLHQALDHVGRSRQPTAMPQPLSRVHSDPDVRVTAAALSSKPEFALMAMRVISLWAHIDGDTATIVSLLLKSDIATGLAMYEALSGGEARKAVLIAAAKEALPEWKYLILRAVLAIGKSSRSRRNDYAHGIWGYSEALPDAIILMPSTVVTRFNISRRQVYTVDGASIIRPEDMDRSKMMVHTERDFSAAVQEAEYLQLAYSYLYWTIRGAPEIGRRWLLQQSRIQHALQSLLDGCHPLTARILQVPVDDEPAPEGTHSVA